ncbi:MAG: 1-acyl-sn-glycerol-3-phosphate acyltransferase, partial [Acidobacteria bacterium]|nr:1-acyl-sn-glycerol-3-phosphate acyltransferase [Acidobacteriota bacterium]
IYPEGERAYDGDLHEFKRGAAILATELNLPILPVALDGLHLVWGRESWRIRPAKVRVRFGEPIYPNSATPAADDQYEELTQRLRAAIEKMIADFRSISKTS